eukprot:3962295-Pyramimonas_sp.AAC.1
MQIEIAGSFRTLSTDLLVPVGVMARYAIVKWAVRLGGVGASSATRKSGRGGGAKSKRASQEPDLLFSGTAPVIGPAPSPDDVTFRAGGVWKC